MSQSEKIKVKIIFVCTGNTCRSPMAEFLFKAYLKEHKRSGDFTVTSAGLEAGKGDIMTKQADEALNVLGVKHAAERKARLFTVQMSLENDIIIGMTAEHAMRCDSDNALSFADLIGRSVPDPYGYDTNAYLACAKLISSAFDRVLELADKKLEEKRAAEE